jgi:hypothetical protein
MTSTPIGHGGIEETVHHQGAAVLVQFILDGLAANGDFDQHVHVFGRLVADGNGFDPHYRTPDSAKRRALYRSSNYQE